MPASTMACFYSAPLAWNLTGVDTGGNDYPAKELGLDTIRVRDPEETLAVITAIVACQE